MDLGRNRRLVIILGAGAVILACLASFWAATSGKDIHESPTLAGITERVLAVESTAPKKASAAQAHIATGSAPLDPTPHNLFDSIKGKPLDLAIAALKPLADSGDPDAMRMLADKLRDCHFAERGGDEEVRRRVIDRLLDGERRMNDGRPWTNELQAAASEIKTALTVRDQCVKVDAKLSSQWFGWLERSAQAGDVQARLDYASFATWDFPAGEKTAAQTDEIQRRQRTGLDYLEQVLQSGNCAAALTKLEHMYGAFVNGATFRNPDRVMLAYAYSQASWRMAVAEDPKLGLDPGWSKNFEAISKALTQAQMQAAQAQGDGIYTQYCQGRSSR